MVSIADRSKNWYNLARRVLRDPVFLSGPLVHRPLVGNPRREGLTWAFLRESLYLRERARNINPRAATDPFADFAVGPSTVGHLYHIRDMS